MRYRLLKIAAVILLLCVPVVLVLTWQAASSAWKDLMIFSPYQASWAVGWRLSVAVLRVVAALFCSAALGALSLCFIWRVLHLRRGQCAQV